MSRSSFFFLIVGLIIFAPLATWAQEPTTGATVTPSTATTSSATTSPQLRVKVASPVVTPRELTPTTKTASSPLLRSDNEGKQLSQLQARATKEIERRITALTRIQTIIGKMQHLTDSDKTSLTQQVAAEITALTELKTKINAETELAALKTDVQSIVTRYRVFAIFIPKIHLLAAATSITDINSNLTTLATKLQTELDTAKATGLDTTSLQATLTDLQTQVATAQKQAQDAQTLLLPLAPADYPANKTSLEQAQTMIKTARQALATARHDAHTILAALHPEKTISSPTATTTPAPTASSLPSPSL